MNLFHSYQRHQLLRESSIIDTGIFRAFLSSSTSIPQGKHVMVSHDISDETIVSEIFQFLCSQAIPIWFDKGRRRGDNIYDRYVCSNYHCETHRTDTICMFVFQFSSRSGKCSMHLLFCQSRVRKLGALSNRTTVCE